MMATDNAGVFLSSENRTKWTSIGDKLPNKKINALYIDGNDILVGVYQKGIYKSADNGNTWTSLNFNLTKFKCPNNMETTRRIICWHR